MPRLLTESYTIPLGHLIMVMTGGKAKSDAGAEATAVRELVSLFSRLMGFSARFNKRVAAAQYWMVLVECARGIELLRQIKDSPAWPDFKRQFEGLGGDCLPAVPIDRKQVPWDALPFWGMMLDTNSALAHFVLTGRWLRVSCVDSAVRPLIYGNDSVQISRNAAEPVGGIS